MKITQMPVTPPLKKTKPSPTHKYYIYIARNTHTDTHTHTLSCIDMVYTHNSMYWSRSHYLHTVDALYTVPIYEQNRWRHMGQKIIETHAHTHTGTTHSIPIHFGEDKLLCGNAHNYWFRSREDKTTLRNPSIQSRFYYPIIGIYTQLYI